MALLLAVPTIAVASAASTDASWWQPTADQNLRWYWQLQSEINTSYDVDIYNIDIDTPQGVIDALKARDVRLICYFSVGTVEQWRSDEAAFPPEVVGEVYSGYEDENWLDISQFLKFSSVMRARLNRCAAKGFDGVEGDNVDAFNQHIEDSNGVARVGTSFKVTRKQSTDYVLWLAAESHKRGLAFGLKNAEKIAKNVVAKVDWLITESCFVDNWCAEASLFVEHNKPVFMTEYIEYLPDFSKACRQAKLLGFSAIYRDIGLSASGIFKECL